jgi:hypothetical protein
VHAGEHGLYPTLYADQVEFVRPRQRPKRRGRSPQDTAAWIQTLRNAPPPAVVPLSDVPPRVFSEVMRDVELFVSVASITLDPVWHDRQGPEAAYWKRAAFGELNVAARERRQVLEEMLRWLSIGPRCRIEDRFLVVKGQLRTYRIHIGSTQILMEPRDHFLRLSDPPPGRGRTQTSHALPSGDPDIVLGLLLRKAFVLANDSAIADPAIRRVIERASLPLN